MQGLCYLRACSHTKHELLHELLPTITMSREHLNMHYYMRLNYYAEGTFFEKLVTAKTCITKRRAKGRGQVHDEASNCHTDRTIWPNFWKNSNLQWVTGATIHCSKMSNCSSTQMVHWTPTFQCSTAQGCNPTVISVVHKCKLLINTVSVTFLKKKTQRTI